MGDYTHTDLKLVGRHVPDPMVNNAGVQVSPQELGYDTINPVTGTYEIGVEIEGAFVPLISEKASLIFDRIDTAQAQAQADAEAQKAQTTPAPDTGPQAGVAPEDQSSITPQGDQPQPQG